MITRIEIVLTFRGTEANSIHKEYGNRGSPQEGHTQNRYPLGARKQGQPPGGAHPEQVPTRSTETGATGVAPTNTHKGYGNPVSVAHLG